MINRTLFGQIPERNNSDGHRAAGSHRSKGPLLLRKPGRKAVSTVAKRSAKCLGYRCLECAQTRHVAHESQPRSRDREGSRLNHSAYDTPKEESPPGWATSPPVQKSGRPAGSSRLARGCAGRMIAVRVIHSALWKIARTSTRAIVRNERRPLGPGEYADEEYLRCRHRSCARKAAGVAAAGWKRTSGASRDRPPPSPGGMPTAGIGMCCCWSIPRRKTCSAPGPRRRPYSHHRATQAVELLFAGPPAVGEHRSAGLGVGSGVRMGAGQL